MPKKRMTDEQWLNAINDCRASGLSDKDWCSMHGIHTATFYRAIRRLRKKACQIPIQDKKAMPLPQEIVEIASVDENGVITQAKYDTPASGPANDQLPASFERCTTDISFESTVRITTPSGISIELTNNSNAAIIKNVLSALQSL